MNTHQLRQRARALDGPMGPFCRFSWDFRRHDLLWAIETKEPEGFLTWSGIHEALFVGNAPYIEDEFDALPPHYTFKVVDSGFGCPEFYNETLTGNYIHQMYHLWTWEQETGRSVKEMSVIVEFGGGYGAMAAVCRQLGFGGTYIIVDFPEFHLLQEYYLSNTVGMDGIALTQTAAGQVSMIIGCFSFSEAPIEARDNFFGKVSAPHHLIAYQPQFYGVDNVEYFSNLAGERFMKNHQWYLVR